jgi:uncharacterized protein (TIGR02118 family)
MEEEETTTMVKLMALYKQPRDPETFERIYFGEHVPLARKMPGLRRLEIDRITGAPRGEPEYYLVAHLYFDDAETMQRSMASEESRAAAAVLRDLGAEVSLVLAEGDQAGDKSAVEAQPMARPAADFGFEKILYLKEDGRATVTINRPKVYNALDFQTLREMSRAFEDASWDDSVAVVVLTGAGDRAFCTGADVREMQELASGGPPNDFWKWMGAFIEAQDRLRHIGKPTIARLNGMTVGGGNEFNLACDLAVAADDISIRQVDIARGAVPAGGGTQWLPLLVGDRRAREIVWLGEQISAQQALAWGLVNRVVPRAELDVAVDEMVAKLKQTMPECFRYAQQQANFWKDLAWNETVGHTRDWLTIHLRAPETQEGFRAFVEKRPIDYAGLRAGTIPTSPPTAETHTCPHCGAGDLPQGFAYCGHCGQSIQ